MARNARKASGKQGIDQLVRVYEDLETVLRSLKKREKHLSLVPSQGAIDVRRLIEQLGRSKKRLERKIGNTLLLEKAHLKRRIRHLKGDLKVVSDLD